MTGRELRLAGGAAALVAALVVAGPGAGAQSSAPHLDARATALAHLSRQEIPAARAAIATGLQRQPNDAGLLEVLGQLDWRLLHTSSALKAFERAAGDAAVGADAQLGLGRIAAFRGWQAEGAFPGWHEEVDQRPRALAAYQRAITLRPTWATPHVALGEALLLDGQATPALAEIDAALALARDDPDAQRGRARALAALGRSAEATIAPDAATAAVAGIDAALKSGAAAKAAADAVAFVRAYPHSPRLIDAYDRLLSAYQAWPDAPLAEVSAALDRRVALRPDPGTYYAGAALMLARPGAVGRVRALAEAGAVAGETLILENRSAYKLEGKVQASRDRNHAQAADLIGWAAFLQGDLATAGTKLEESARLWNGADFLNQFHRAELARKSGAADIARERYYEALSLQGGAPAMRASAQASLAALYAAEGTSASDATAAIDRDLERRREERRLALVGSALGQPLPPLATTNIDGTPATLLAEPGKVTLLNFFASWCGACRAEMPLVQQAYERYKDDPKVRFVLVSLDDDPKRLERYMAERKFAMPVLRSARAAAEAALNVLDTPTTFYVDAGGTIRYEVKGLEPHGDAVARVAWYIEQLKK
ncbi:MAG: redoxin family protein [Acidobacteriota bacterium]